MHGVAFSTGAARSGSPPVGLVPGFPSSGTTGVVAMTVTALATFAGLCLLLAVTPGPDALLVVRSASEGVRYGAAAAIGSGIGSLCWSFAVAVGLATFLAASVTAFLVVKIVGGLYLLYMGAKGLQRVGRHAASRMVRPSAKVFAAFRSGLTSCVLNPEVGLFFLAVVPQFLPSGPITYGTVMTLGLIDAVVATGCLCLMAIGSARAVTWFRRPKVFDVVQRGSSVAIAVLGAVTITSAVGT
jgi:threonine/homoserine/homoserine lactone efflux protein